MSTRLLTVMNICVRAVFAKLPRGLMLPREAEIVFDLTGLPVSKV